MNDRKLTIKEYKQLIKLDRINIGQEVKDQQTYCYKPYRTLKNY